MGWSLCRAVSSLLRTALSAGGVAGDPVVGTRFSTASAAKATARGTGALLVRRSPSTTPWSHWPSSETPGSTRKGPSRAKDHDLTAMPAGRRSRTGDPPSSPAPLARTGDRPRQLLTVPPRGEAGRSATFVTLPGLRMAVSHPYALVRAAQSPSGGSAERPVCLRLTFERHRRRLPV